MNAQLRKTLFILLALTVLLWPEIKSAYALILGLLFGVIVQNPFIAKTKVWTPKLLSYAIVGLGAGMNLEVALKVGLSGFLFTAISIIFTILLGLALGRLFRQNAHISMLLAVGTAICGGSAIAAVAPVIRARSEEISLSLGIVFLLNALALFIFPSIGHTLDLSQTAFGTWAALAIHDTSSVVGATLSYGSEALQIGTTVKLARALWIVPVTLLIGVYWTRFQSESREADGSQTKKYPWFILGFLLMAALYTWIPSLGSIFQYIEFGARRIMVLSLFLIGANLNITILKGMGLRPFFQGLLLWFIVALLTLFSVTQLNV